MVSSYREIESSNKEIIVYIADVGEEKAYIKYTIGDSGEANMDLAFVDCIYRDGGENKKRHLFTSMFTDSKILLKERGVNHIVGQIVQIDTNVPKELLREIYIKVGFKIENDKLYYPL